MRNNYDALLYSRPLEIFIVCRLQKFDDQRENPAESEYGYAMVVDDGGRSEVC